VRDLEVGSVNRFRAVEEDVEVDFARAFGELFLATELRFDRAQGFEERMRREVCFCLHNAIEEPRLVEIVDWFGFVNRGSLLEADAGRRKRGYGGAEIGLAVSYI
jgi:hypothetical protein